MQIAEPKYFDIVWCTGEHEYAAVGLVRRLHPVEITLRGIEGMRGLRVTADQAPMPEDESGRFKGMRGSVIMRNFLGSQGIRAGAIAEDASGKQMVRLATYCRTIEILQRDRDGRPTLAGGMLRSDHMDDELRRESEYQLERERRDKERRTVMGMSGLEISMVRAAILVRAAIVGPFDFVSRAVRGGKVGNACAIPVALIGTLLSIAVLIGIERPVQWVCYKMENRREQKRLDLLCRPFQPFVAARKAAAFLAGR